MHGSDEEGDDPPEVDSDEDLSDEAAKHDHEEVCVCMFYYTSYILTLFIKKILYIQSSRRKKILTLMNLYSGQELKWYIMKLV